MQKITLIAAYAARQIIGQNGTIPWHISEDFAFFKAYTLGKPVVMGRKTWESLPKKPLSGRRNIVISRNSGLVLEGAEVADDPMKALALCAAADEVVIMGGAEIYRRFLPLATDLRITEVVLDVAGDAFFPPFGADEWREVSRENRISAKGIGFALVHYERIQAA